MPATTTTTTDVKLTASPHETSECLRRRRDDKLTNSAAASSWNTSECLRQRQRRQRWDAKQPKDKTYSLLSTVETSVQRPHDPRRLQGQRKDGVEGEGRCVVLVVVLVLRVFFCGCLAYFRHQCKEDIYYLKMTDSCTVGISVF